MKNCFYLSLAIPVIFAVSCKTKTSTDTGDTAKRTVFFDKTGMDTTVKPGDDFFSYANGNWIKKTVIPPSEMGWGSFFVVEDENEKDLHKILDNISAQDNTAGSAAQKVADLYISGMDTTTIDKLGYDPIKPELAKISTVKDYKDLVKLAAERFKDGNGFLFGFYISPDDKISTKNTAHFDQTGLGLPDRDYYLKTDTASVKIRAKYVEYIAKLFTLTGTDAPTANKKAADILKLETEIAKSHSTQVELRDPIKKLQQAAYI